MQKNDFESVLISREQITARVAELAAEIDRDYADKNPLFICILKGSAFFFTDLLKELTIPAEIDFMAVSSYGSGTTSGYVKMVKDLDRPIDGRHVIIVEDMVDSGNTLSYLRELLLTRDPASLAICTLMDKPERRVAAIDVDYTGFQVPDEFVVGYGLDYAERYRTEPEIYILKREIYEK
ncbi:MAG: hypoxanthine phosphoribosyltransferase [Clostridia bacterium]|nr:hypoxanthine phosphoribosyltransferase [Clostridia bacterium]